MSPETSSPRSIYQQRIGSYTGQIDRLRLPLRWIPWIRLFLVAATGISLYEYFKFPGYIFPGIALAAFSGFLAAGWYDSDLKKRILLLQQLVHINEQEINALDGKIGGFGDGNQFAGQDHPYTHDLDIFGKGSLFQYLNRTSTIFGTIRLADYLGNAFNYSTDILARQEAIREFAGQIEFRQQLQLIFAGQDTSASDPGTLDEWLNGQEGIKWMKPMKVLSWVLPLITMCSVILSATGFLPHQVPVIMILLQMLIVFAYGRKSQVVHRSVTSQVGIMNKYARALSLAEAAPFTCQHNTKLQVRLRNDAGERPGLAVKRISDLLNMMDSNLNILVAVIMNGLFMFNIHILIAVERWRLAYRSLVPGWFDVLAETDALSCLGTFAFNNPQYIYPEPVAGEFMFVAEKMGHPLIPRETCVTNDLQIDGWNQFRIITGANMSGKSTFLRTVGINMVLAMAGAPVFAEKFRFYPIEIHSSIRTNDSLARRESYFYAELRRLREIIAGLESGHRKLILLDEILKGTNSSDKQTGSIALIKQLMKYELAGLFATHDLALGDLVNHYPDNIKNLCFEIKITGDRMEIDYKLSPGVCRNLNASFLMRNMGIILDEPAC